ncbi:MAG: hypothetical protein CL581_04870 [Alteromonadaceae bacterium]|nr:hypothetical protein [Alteromonadaceae bacterium]MBH87237.1 hypothetical protein [Alteromonadaceae bacterium]
MLILELLLLLLAANGAPVLGSRLMGRVGNAPIDGGIKWRDGVRLLGGSKTWRGFIVGTASCALLSALLGLGVAFGAVFGALALLGDLISSFIKRRRRLAPSSRSTGLDQFPESFLPVLFGHFWLGYGWLTLVVTVALFMLANIMMSPLLYRLGIRKQPH